MQAESATVKRGVVTVAFGSERYIGMARNLAISVRRNWPGTALTLVTDSSDEKLNDLFDSVVIMDETIGRNLLQKLNLDRYTPYDETLFLDSDCLVVRDMSFTWDLYRDVDFAVAGTKVSKGDWFGAEIEEVRNKLGIEEPISKFNGGLMYWKSNNVGRGVFQEARRLSSEYSALGFEAFRSDLPHADEPLISLAMAKYGVSARDDRGTTMATPIGLNGRLHIDSLLGYCSFVKNGNRVSPAAPHFCGPYSRGAYYRREAQKLRSITKGVWYERFARCGIDLVYWPITLLDHSVVWNMLQLIRRIAKRTSRKPVL